MNDIKDFREASIVAGILIAIFLLLFFINFPVKAEKEKGLAVVIQNVLDSDSKNTLQVGEFFPISSPLQTSFTVYTISDTKEPSYTCLVRITGVCGPVPVVYTYSALKGIKYLGIAGNPDVFDDYGAAGISYTQLNYWSKRIPTIIKDSLHE